MFTRRKSGLLIPAGVTRRAFLAGCGATILAPKAKALLPGSLTGFGGSAYVPQTLLQTLTDLHLTTNLKLCLDAGDAASYTSGQKWLDTSGGGEDFFLGADGSATATDPTFNGVAGAKSSAEFFSLDGGDYFTYDTTNPAWVETLHKDNAIFTFLCWVYIGVGSTAQRLCGTVGHLEGSTGIGFRIGITTSNKPQLLVRNGSADVLATSGAGTMLIGSWQMVAVSINEATGTNGCTIFISGSHTLHDSTYTSPTASSATSTLQLAAGGQTSSTPLTAGSRMSMAAFLQGTAMTADNFANIFQHTRDRLSV